MASIRIRGEAEVIARLRALQFKFREKTITKAAMAGAEIAKTAIQGRAPTAKRENRSNRPTGTIKENIIIYKRRRSIEQQGESISYLIGPSRNAFYGYFVEHGIAGKKRIAAREFVDDAYKECRGRMRQAIIETLTNALKAE